MPKLCLSRPYHFKFFKGCLPQVVLGPFLNTLPHITETLVRKKVKKPQVLFNLYLFVLMKKLTFTAFLFDILDGWLCRRYVFAQKIMFAQNNFFPLKVTLVNVNNHEKNSTDLLLFS